MTRRAVIFDLDNTLTHRRASVERFAELFAADFEARLQPLDIDDLRAILIRADGGGYNPRRAEEIVAALSWRTAPAVDEVESHWQERFPHASVLRPGVPEVLVELRHAGFRLGVVTNGGVRAQRRKLELLELVPLFTSIVVSEAAGCEKPDPRIFEQALRELDVRAEEAWFVGDHPEKDVLGARACGLSAVWIRDDGDAWPAARPPPPPDPLPRRAAAPRRGVRLMQHRELRNLVDELLYLVEVGSGSTSADEAELSHLLDRLALALRHLVVPEAPETPPEIPVRNVEVLAKVAGSRFPGLGAYHRATPVAAGTEPPRYEVVRAVDDVAVVADHLHAVAWLWRHASEDLALWYLDQSHHQSFGRAMRGLQLYLHEREARFR